MQPDEVKQLIEQGLKDSQATVAGEGKNFDLCVVWEGFAGLAPVKRQQAVYAALQEHITAGNLHAITMRTYTAAEYAANRQG